MRNGKPFVVDGYCGLGGWSEAFISTGWECVGIDIEKHDYGNGGYPGQLVLQDMRTINGGQFKDADLLVFSPPCTEYSYMGMPWKRGKQIAAALRGQGDFPVGYKGSRTVAELNDLFNQCFRIQREVSAAAGHYVPIIVENVRGAQRWVGKARWNFGSFCLWGDVPALMPIPIKQKLKTTGPMSSSQSENSNCHINEMRDALKSEGNKMGSSPGKIWRDRPPSVAAHRELTRSEGNKTAGMNWSDRSIKGQDFTRIAGMQAEGTKVPSESGRRMAIGKGARFTSKSKSRKEMSAEIAKIPYALASWIAKTYKPKL